MTAQMQFEMVFKAQTGAARAATNDLRKDVGALGTEAVQSAGALDRHASSMDRDAASATSLARSAENARRTLASIGAAAGSAQPSMDRLINTFARLDAPAANRNGRVADIAAYGQELDRLQAKFDPLFAAQQRYKTKIAEITQAEQVGALSATNAIEIRLREKNTYDALISNVDRLNVARKAAAEGVVSSRSIVPDRGSDIEAYGRQLDQLRTKFNPVYAVIAGYRERLAEIREANRIGAISTDEMTAAIQRQRQAALASIEVIKGRNTAVHSGGAANNNFAANNAMFQFQDIAMTAAMGMNPLMVGLQQGTQLAGGFAGMSVKEAGSAALGGITGLINPLSLVTVGLTVASAAAIQFFTTSASEGKTASDVIEAQAGLIKELAAAWGVATNEAKTYTEAQKIIAQTNASAGLVETQKQQQKAFETLNAKFFEFGVGKQYNNIPGFAEQFGKAFSDLEDSIKNGSADVDGFVESIKRIDDANPGFAKVGNEFIKLAEDLYKLNGEAKKTVDIMTQIALQGSRLDPLGVFDAGKQQQRLADLTPSKTELLSQQIDAYRLTTDAKSPQEKAAAARATAAAQFNPSESSTDRANRIELAGQQALISAEKQLAEAKRDRARSIDDTLTSARLELSLIGQTTSSIESQRMELRLLTEAKTAAEKAGTTVSDDEVTRIKQAAAEYGRLQEAIKATNILRDQSDSIQQLRLEISLIGQSAAARARALALAQAEKQIRDQGISASGQQAQKIRENAAAMADEGTKLDRLHDAWNTMQSTGENAIDAIGEAIRTGDWAGAVNSVIADIQKSFIQLGFTNPLKNALFGTNYGTLADAGGLIGSMLGGSSVSSMATSSIGAMNVNAASVVINGAVGSGGLLSSLSGAANDNLAGAAAAMTDKGGVGAQVWNFFASKGLKDFQIAGIMGNVARESSFNPTAVGDGGDALGLFQWNDRAPAMLNAIGGRGNLSNVSAQLNYAWKELQTSESGALSRLLKSTNLNDATAAFAGFERPRGWSLQNPQGADGFSARLSGAESALSKFGSTTSVASSASDALGRGMTGATDASGKLGSGLNSAALGLDQLGSGLDRFGQALAAAQSGGNSGLADLLGSFTKVGVSAFNSSAQFQSAVMSGMPGLWSDGGFTGNIDEKEIAGYVHGGEFVFSKRAVDKIGLGNLDAMHRQARGYSSGGYVISANSNVGVAPVWPSAGQAPTAAAAPVINVINRNGSNVKVNDRSTANGVAIDVMIDEAVAEKVSKLGSNTGRAIQSQFGLNRGLSRR